VKELTDMTHVLPDLKYEKSQISRKLQRLIHFCAKENSEVLISQLKAEINEALESMDSQRFMKLTNRLKELEDE